MNYLYCWNGDWINLDMKIEEEIHDNLNPQKSLSCMVTETKPQVFLVKLILEELQSNLFKCVRRYE